MQCNGISKLHLFCVQKTIDQYHLLPYSHFSEVRGGGGGGGGAGAGAEGREGQKRQVRSTRGFVTKNVHSLTTLLSHSKVIREYSYKCIK